MPLAALPVRRVSMKPGPHAAFGALLALALIAPLGCRKAAPGAAPAGGGGVISNVKAAVDNQRASFDLREIARFYLQQELTGGGPPRDLPDFLGFMERDSPKLA